EPRLRVGLPGDHDLQQVVVPVPVRVAARAEHLPVALLAPLGAVVPVGGAEADGPGKIGRRHRRIRAAFARVWNPSIYGAGAPTTTRRPLPFDDVPFPARRVLDALLRPRAVAAIGASRI